MSSIHPSAVIDKSAQIADNVEIGPFTIIGPKTIIKSGVKIHGQAVIEYAEIGENCEIFNFASIGKRPQDMKYQGEETFVSIGAGTTVREAVTINRGTAAAGRTALGRNCLLMSCSHIAHDCIIGDGVIVGYSTGLAGHVEAGDYVIFSGACGVHQFCKIGKHAFVSGGAKVVMDIIPYAVAQGDRAALIGLNEEGMKRSSMSEAEIEEVKNAYKTLFLSKLMLNIALDKLRQTDSVFVKDILFFIENSTRGLVRPLRNKEKI